MITQVIGEADVMREASEVLLAHLDPAKIARVWANWHTGQGDYLQWRDEEFEGETVADLYEQIAAFQDKS
jgi:hypothetical protein